MGKHIQLSIDNPCHENWNNMAQVDKGRFCTACQKQVVDFTSMSDPQIAAFFKKPAGSLSKDGTVCGRFFQDQLDRNIEIPKKRIPWVKYFFQFALPAFFMSARAIAQGGAGVCIKNTTTVITPSKFPGNSHFAPLTNILIHGKVINENDSPIPFASIMIKGGKGLGVSADSSGVFSVKNISVDMDILLEVSSVGYETKEMLIKRGTDLTKDLMIRLSQQVMDEVVVSGNIGAVTKRMVLGGAVSVMTIKRITETSITKSPAEMPSMIKVYPNPVVSGTSINIGCQKLQEGYYTIQLSNQSGQQVLNKQTWIDGEIQVLNIDIPVVTAGVYFLRLTNKETNKRFTQKIIVQ